MNKFISLQRSGPIAEIIFNKPERRNALCLAMWRAIPTLLAEAVQDDTICVVIFHGGTSGTFAAGADITEFEEIYATPERAAASSAVLTAAVDAIEHCPKPTVAAIEGACVGGGVSVACACDIRFAGDGAKFAVTPGKLGLLYSPGDTRRLIARVGASAAKDLLFSGRLITIDEALRIGLIDHRLDKGDALPKARAWAEMVSTLAQSSVQATKTMIQGLEQGWTDQSPEAQKLFLETFGGDDFKEGYQAFLEKRPPHFPGNSPSNPGGKGD